jgi:hypothetical protein
LLESGADFRRKTGQYRSFANTIMQKKVSDFLLEKDQNSVLAQRELRIVRWCLA